MARGHWLVKSEPSKYGFADLVRDGRTRWDGVRNPQALGSLRAMQKGELALFYHSNEGLEVVGVARVAREAYADPGASDPRFVVVDIEPVRSLARPVSLATIKADPKLREIPLVRQSRLSVMPLAREAFERILELGGS